MVGFTEESARAVGKATQWVAQHKTTQPGRGRGRWAGWNSRWEIGKTNGTLSTNCDTGTCGTVGVSIYLWDGLGFADSGQDVTAVCPLLGPSDSIATDTWVAVAKHRRNVWVIIAVQCP